MCLERIQEMLELVQQAQLDMDIVSVGSGTPRVGARVLRHFAGQHPSQSDRLRMYTDEPKVLYKRMSLHRGVRRTFTWTRWANVVGLCSFPREMARVRAH